MGNAGAVYSEKVVDHALNPRNVGVIQYPDGYGRATIQCGDTLQICLRVKDNIITDAKFVTNGCGPTIACGSITSELIKGKSVSEALEITEEDIIGNLDGLPESEVHCSHLAASTLRQAIRDYLLLKREPWKKNFRIFEPL